MVNGTDAMRMYVPMRWKLLIAFAAAYTLVFGFIAYWVIDFATDTALAQLELQLENTASGGSQSVDDAAFVTLITTVPGGAGCRESHRLRLP